MAFDREAFKKRAEAKALQERAKHVTENKPVEKKTESTGKVLSAEEQQVIKAYREWKASKAGKVQESAPKQEAPVQETRTQRVERLRRKLERRARVEALKAKLQEKKTDAPSNDLRAKAKSLKERIAKIRKALKEEGENPTDFTPNAPGMDMGMNNPNNAAVPNLPPEITAEIQNIAAAAQSLAQMAGVAPMAPQFGPDVNAGVPGEMAGAAGAVPNAMPSMPEKTKEDRKKAIIEKIKANKAKALKEEEGSEAGAAAPEAAAEGSESVEESVENTRNRVAERRKALAALRAKAMDEGYDEVPPIGDKAAKLGLVVIPQDNGVSEGYPKPNAAPDAHLKGSATLKAGKVWPTTKGPTKSTFEVQEAAEKPAGEKLEEKTGKMEESWVDRDVDRYLARREFDFKALLKNGQLG